MTLRQLTFGFVLALSYPRRLPPFRSTGHRSLAPRPTIVAVRRRCRAPNWSQNSPSAGVNTLRSATFYGCGRSLASLVLMQVNTQYDLMSVHGNFSKTPDIGSSESFRAQP